MHEIGSALLHAGSACTAGRAGPRRQPEGRRPIVSRSLAAHKLPGPVRSHPAGKRGAGQAETSQEPYFRVGVLERKISPYGGLPFRSALKPKVVGRGSRQSGRHAFLRRIETSGQGAAIATGCTLRLGQYTICRDPYGVFACQEQYIVLWLEIYVSSCRAKTAN